MTNVIPSSSQIPTPPHHTRTCLALRKIGSFACAWENKCVPVPVCVFMLRVNYRGTATTRHPCVQSPSFPRGDRVGDSPAAMHAHRTALTLPKVHGRLDTCRDTSQQLASHPALRASNFFSPRIIFGPQAACCPRMCVCMHAEEGCYLHTDTHIRQGNESCPQESCVSTVRVRLGVELRTTMHTRMAKGVTSQELTRRARECNLRSAHTVTPPPLMNSQLAGSCRGCVQMPLPHPSKLLM